MIQLVPRPLDTRARLVSGALDRAGPATDTEKIAYLMPTPIRRAIGSLSASTGVGGLCAGDQVIAQMEKQLPPDSSALDFADWNALASAVEERLRRTVCRRLPAATASDLHDLRAARVQATVLECVEALGQLRAMVSRMQK